jgi:hypothetical protein
MKGCRLMWRRDGTPPTREYDGLGMLEETQITRLVEGALHGEKMGDSGSTCLSVNIKLTAAERASRDWYEI